MRDQRDDATLPTPPAWRLFSPALCPASVSAQQRGPFSCLSLRFHGAGCATFPAGCSLTKLLRPLPFIIFSPPFVVVLLPRSQGPGQTFEVQVDTHAADFFEDDHHLLASEEEEEDEEVNDGPRFSRAALVLRRLLVSLQQLGNSEELGWGDPTKEMINPV